ncbi:hypothetical protein [uncultured Amnibacterium sp.]|uniref:hypothetical protein n=1 Tax=uncultured Amnibacterium sp. TaxID=1631851 RepID=UPI0035CB78E2
MKEHWLLLAASAPPELWEIWDRADVLPDRLYRPSEDDGPTTLAAAASALAQSAMEAPDGLIPLTYVDDRSLACLAVTDDVDFGWKAGWVLRWHLDEIPALRQGRPLDRSLGEFMQSLSEETGPGWQVGLDGMREVSARYQSEFVVPGITPKSYDLRPFQLASQNVVIGLAAVRYDARFDGSSVVHWLTSDVPHVATFEGVRALAALILCDAFQSGGTMEIDFSEHPERGVPASLRRYGRTVGIELGAEMPGGVSISPSESRQLFWKVTPMPDSLRYRAQFLIDGGLLTVERLCYSVLAPVWTPEALDFLVAVAAPNRLGSILSGETDPRRRGSGFEYALMRAALVFETFLRRLDARDGAAGDDGESERVFEDTRHGVSWTVLDESGAVLIEGYPAGALPWSSGSESDGRIVVLPRAHVAPPDVDLLAELERVHDAPARVIVPQDAVVGPHPEAVLRAPARQSEFDARIERNIVAARLGRA